MTVVLDQPAPPVIVAPQLRALRYEPDPGRSAAPDPAVRAGPVPRAHRRGSGGDALRTLAGSILQLALEVVDGRRPLAHLAPHLDASALRYLRAACGQRAPAGARGGSRVLSLHLDRPCAGAAEVAATCRLGGRPRAVAARFERHDEPDGPWRCTVLRIG